MPCEAQLKKPSKGGHTKPSTMTNQTWILLKLNFNRFILKSRLKWVLVALFVLNIGLFALLKPALSRLSSPPNEPFEIKKSPVLFIDDAAVPGLDSMTRFSPEFVVVRVSKQDYLNEIKANGTKRISFLIEMKGEREYSVHYPLDGSISPTRLYECLGANCMLFSLPQIAVTLARFNALLKGETQPPFVLFSVRTGSGTSFVSLFQDFIYLILAYMVTNGLLEDRMKGIKFGLFMTGVRRSSYYIGVLSIPFAISFVYCLMNWIFLDQLSRASGSLGVTAVFHLLTAIAYPVWFWFSSQVSKNAKIANVLNILYVVLGLLGPVNEIREFLVYQASWLSVLVCVNPRYAFNLYQSLVAISPLGPGFSNTEIIRGFLSGKV
jgi:hypothetical protein